MFAQSLRKIPRAARRSSKLLVEALEDRLLMAGDLPRVDYSVVQDWGGGFQGQMIVHNDAASPMTNWQLAFDYPLSIDSMWNAKVASHQANHYVLSPESWNSTLAAGSAATIGFTASPGGTTSKPSNYAWVVPAPTPPPTSLNASVDFTPTGDWGSGFNADITVKNLGSSTLKAWTLEFQFDKKIDSIWSAQIKEHTGAKYVVQGASWNTDIPAGGSVKFGMGGTPGLGTAKPTGYILNGVSLGTPTPPPPPALPTLSVADLTVNEGNAGESMATLTVQLSQASTQEVTVQYATSDGTAQAGSDYRAVSSTLTIPAGSTSKTIQVPVLGDILTEADESFRLTLANPANATVLRAQATATIHDDDPALPSPSNYSFTVGTDWGSGFTATMNVTNTKSTGLQDWTIAFDAPFTITSIWDAKVLQQQGSRYILGPADWNRFVAKGGAISFGFNGSPGRPATPTNLILDGTPADAPPTGGGSSGGTGGGSTTPPPAAGETDKILIAGVDGATPVTQFTMDLATKDYNLSFVGNAQAKFRVTTNNGDVINASIVGDKTLHLQAIASGRASLRIEEIGSGLVRYVGLRVRTADGKLPGLPSYVAMGSVSEDTTADLGFWKDFANPSTNKRMDIRYIYLNGGPSNGWSTWSNSPGGRVTSYLRESQKLGIVPYFVYYNIPDGGESYWTDTQHIQDASYMAGYFKDLKFVLDLIHAGAPDDPVGMILEPDFLGYMMQSSGTTPDKIQAMTHAAYSSGVLNQATDPAFPDTVQGLVKAINYTIAKYTPNVTFGWQFNLWASSGEGSSVPANGLMHITDTKGIAAGRAIVASEAQKIANYYEQAGILSYGASFVSIDKYGLDAGAENGAAANPAGSTWFWNNDHWQNYLLFSKTLHDTTGLPVVLWQLPVGHINGSLAVNPYDSSGRFPDLNNTTTHFEDSAPNFFFGDSFTATGSRFNYFATNKGADPKVTTSGSTITWGSHIADAEAAGISAILFGAGVGDSTDGVGSPPTDDYWWISKVEEYYLGQ